MARKKVTVVRLSSDPFQRCGIDRKLKFAVRLAQIFIRESLLSYGFDGKTFSLEGDEDSGWVNGIDGAGGEETVGSGVGNGVGRDGAGAVNGGDVIADLEKDFVLTPWDEDIDVDQNPKKIWTDLAQMLVRCGDFNARLKYLVVGSLAGDGGIVKLSHFVNVGRARLTHPHEKQIRIHAHARTHKHLTKRTHFQTHTDYFKCIDYLMLCDLTFSRCF